MVLVMVLVMAVVVVLAVGGNLDFVRLHRRPRGEPHIRARRVRVGVPLCLVRVARGRGLALVVPVVRREAEVPGEDERDGGGHHGGGHGGGASWGWVVANNGELRVARNINTTYS